MRFAEAGPRPSRSRWKPAVSKIRYGSSDKPAPAARSLALASLQAPAESSVGANLAHLGIGHEDLVAVRQSGKILLQPLLLRRIGGVREAIGELEKLALLSFSRFEPGFDQIRDHAVCADSFPAGDRIDAAGNLRGKSDTPTQRICHGASLHRSAPLCTGENLIPPQYRRPSADAAQLLWVAVVCFLQPTVVDPRRHLGSEGRKPGQVISTRLNADRPPAIEAFCRAVQRYNGRVGPSAQCAVPVS